MPHAEKRDGKLRSRRDMKQRRDRCAGIWRKIMVSAPWDGLGQLEKAKISQSLDNDPLPADKRLTRGSQ
jgi:hypothetical protein